MDKKKYKLSEDELIGSSIGIGKIISYAGILALICIISFLVAKFIVNIGVEEKPIDISERI